MPPSEWDKCLLLQEMAVSPEGVLWRQPSMIKDASRPEICPDFNLLEVIYLGDAC